ncbi:hypothetical protein Moror_6723 [Moniliophthora roreri MCA 2997]|uniref:Uncharacterized protein n=1 Tax=Moniliophthora roreri (strain MCA 2997) TaxID=1381753 RepID=V2XV30_MONRO|nr:hypothetical protein Moror_6723 [Moniliophthora roreri MCA 2997]
MNTSMNTSMNTPASTSPATSDSHYSKSDSEETLHSCDHPESRFLVRCGCPNDKPPSHPMHSMDDAFHREWCSKCLIFCYQPPHCRFSHTTSGTVTNRRFFLGIIYAFVARVVRSFAICVSFT